MQKISPFLWFDNNAEEAVSFYMSVFKKTGKILNTLRSGGASSKGPIITISFEIGGQKFVALNGGPQFKFTEAVSFVVPCDTQDEVDEYWDKLLVGGEPQQCGWLKDKFGLSWQVVPNQLSEVLGDKDPVKAKKAMDAMMKMVKLDINELKRAAEA